MKTRIIKQITRSNGDWFIPQYYIEPYFFGVFGNRWEAFTEWGGCDPLGFDYGKGDVCFTTEDEAREYINFELNKNKIIVVNPPQEEKRTVYKDVQICDVCTVDLSQKTYHLGEDYFRECEKCGHKVNIY